MKYIVYTLFLCSFAALSMVVFLENSTSVDGQAPFSSSSAPFSRQTTITVYPQ